MLTAADLLLRNATLYPNEVAWVEREGDVSHSITWRQLSFLAAGLSDWLLSHGVTSEDRVVWWDHNSLEWILLDLACSALGAVSVPLDPRLSPRVANEIASRVEPALRLVSTTFAPKLPGLLIPRWNKFARKRNVSSLLRHHQDDKLATILFTSGTSGEPKGVMLSHRNLMTNAFAKLAVMPQYRTDHRLNLLPFAHAYARTCELNAWLHSASCMEVARGVDDLIERIGDVRPTLLNGVPVVFERILEHAESMGGLDQIKPLLGGRMRQLASGGAPLCDALREAFLKGGYPIYQGYGLTETGPVVCSNVNERSGAPECLDGVGAVIPGTEIAIDADSRLYVRGPGVMMGYWRDEPATRDRFKDLANPNSTPRELWLDTGDLAEYIGDRSAIRILGRADDRIVLSNGYKFDPIAIEREIGTLAGVRDVVAIGGKNGGWSVCLCVDDLEPRLDEMEWRRRVLGSVSQEIAPQLEKVHLFDQEWPPDEGLLNFKGGKKRAEFTRRFG